VDTVLTNRQTEKLNFDTNYITIITIRLSNDALVRIQTVKPGFHMVVMVVKIESRSFSTASL
jgi:hypothetical protein